MSKRTIRALGTLLIVLSMTTLNSIGNAQTTFGSIVGTAADSSGAVMPGVTVTVTSDETGVSQTQETNDLGAYAFTTLLPGRYSIHSEFPGFKSVDIRSIVLQVNQTVRFNLTMEIGEVTENVEVIASAPVLSTDTSDVGQVIANREILDLPLNGRNYLQLAALTNGVVTFGDKGGENAGPRFTSQGTRSHGNSYLVDGVDTRNQRQDTYGLSLSVDAIGEFKIMQNAFSAEYGRGTTIVNSTVKSGSNQFHGSAFWFVRNDKFDARHSYNFTNVKAPLRQNQFGASAGGPIIREKTFFFANYEGERRRRSSISHVLMPTPEMLTGDLSTLGKAIDPDTGTPFPGNIVPAERIARFARAGADYFAIPNGSPIAGRNHTAVTGSSRRGDQGTIRIDHNFNPDIRLNGFVTMFDLEDMSPAPNVYAGTQSTMSTKPTMSIQYTHVLGPTLLNVFQFGRYHSIVFQGADKIADYDVTTEDFGLKNVHPEPDAFGPPRINISGYAAAGAGNPMGITEVNNQVTEQLTYMRGRHTIKLGANLRWLKYADTSWATQNGNLTFNPQYTKNPMADFLLGLPSSGIFSQKGEGKYAFDFRGNELSFYLQDDIKLTQELTINAGLRYELVLFPREADDELTNWNFERHGMDYACIDIPCRVVPTDKNNFGPRVGLAYNPRWSRKTVFRGGFGIAYGNFRQVESALQHFQPPYVFLTHAQNDVPKPSFTTDTLWWPTIIPEDGADYTGFQVNLLTDKVMPMFYQWNFNIQHELLPNLVLQVGYVGNKGVRLPNRYDANQAVEFDPTNPRTIQERRPYQRVGSVNTNGSQAYSNYNGLDVRVERRLSGGLTLLGTYTWMKQMGIRPYDQYSVMYIDNIRHNYGPEGARHRSVISYVYELPFGPGRTYLGNIHGVLGHLVGGWQVNGITGFSAGNWLGTTTSVNNGAGFNHAGNKADATGLPANLPTDERTRAQWFNKAAFVDPPFTRYGNAGEGVIDGPGSVNFDLSIFKNTKITEGTRIQFRCEMFNAFNNVNLSNPNTNVSQKAQFGTISNAAAARIIQLGLKFIF